MITIIATGKVREKYIQEGMQEYLLRLQKYAKVTYREVETLKLPEGYVVALDERGTQYASERFAVWIKKKVLEQKHLVFVIGAAEGLPQEILSQSQERLSLSAMTFPNQLVRLIFLEQLYRAFTIIKGEKYHK